MEIVSWPSGVNRIVTSNTNISIGKNGIKSDNSENGSEMSRMTCSDAPDVYSVNMYFSNSDTDNFFKTHTDGNGRNITEWEAFKQWFKYVLGNGTKAFYFSSLEDPTARKKSIYKISSEGLPSASVTGDTMQVTMTWKEIFNSYINVPEFVPAADFIDPENGRIDFRFTETPVKAPEKTDFTVMVEYDKNKGELTEKVVKAIDYDGFRSVILYVDTQSLEGTYTYYVTYNGNEVNAPFYV